MSKSLAVGVFGASGYAGAELLRLAAGHPDLNVVLATGDTQAGGRVADLYPSLAGGLPRSHARPPPTRPRPTGSTWSSWPCPHGASQDLVPELRKRVGHGRGPGRRLPAAGPDALPQWYGGRAPLPGPAGRGRLRHPRAVSGPTCPAPPWSRRPGATRRPPPWPWPRWCGPASSSAPGVVVDAASGVSGAGRVPKPHTHFNTVDEDFTAYGLLDHRHTPEIEQAIGAAGDLHPPPGPHEPGHPGHLLRPAGRTADRHERAATRSRVLERFYRVRPSWWSTERRRPPKPPWARTAPTSPPATTPAPAGSWPSPPSTT